jgi:uncharacterized OB-fold protein/acyl dehydratase
MTEAAAATEQDLLARLREFEGRQAADPLVAPDEVNAAMIRHWCEVLGDHNPVYTDPEAAAATAHGGLVAPPAMLQVWPMRGLYTKGGPGSPPRALIRLLADAGYPSIIATDCEQEYARYLRPGDRVTATTFVEAVSDEKHTAIGDGFFVTCRCEYTDQAGEVVGTQRFRLLMYRAKERTAVVAGDAPDTGRRPHPAMNDDTAFFWKGAKAGELRIQRCASCGVLRHPPRPSCGACGSLEWDTVLSSGGGSVYSYVVHHHPPVPGFAPPFVVVLVELEEGVRVVSNLVGVEPAAVEIGQPVEVAFEAIDDELTLPVFKVVT